MSPELKEFLAAMKKFADKTEARQWFAENRDSIVSLLADLYEEDRNQYTNVLDDIVENFPHGAKDVRKKIISDVLNTIKKRLDDRLEPHWIDPNDKPDFERDDKGNPAPTQRVFYAILQKSKYLRLCYDEHTKKTYFESFGEYKLPWVVSNHNSLVMKYHVDHREKETKEITYHIADVKYQRAALKFYMANFFNREVNWTALSDAVEYSARQNTINVVQDHFIHGLERWDSEDHFDILYRHAGAKNKEWSRIVMKMIMLGIMARTFEPGYNFRGSAILVGEENLGKSWFTEQLCIHKKFYLQFTFDKSTGEAEIGRKLEGRLVVELPDTGGIGTRNDNQIKSFLTQTTDSFRRMREDNMEEIERNCIFIVTANSMEQYLGHVGNTRFLPIEVGRFDMEAITAEIPQLFAQAKHLWDIGHRPRLNEDELIMQQEMVLQQEVKPRFYFLLLKHLKLQNYAPRFEHGDYSHYQPGITIAELVALFETEVWFKSIKENEYRREIIKTLEGYFKIKSIQSKVPGTRINDRNYRYFGDKPWREFIGTLEE